MKSKIASYNFAVHLQILLKKDTKQKKTKVSVYRKFSESITFLQILCNNRKTNGEELLSV